MALRVPKAELPAGLSESMIEQLAAVPEPVEVTWHNPKVAEAGLEFGRKVSEYAEAMTTTPPTVTDELSARLLDRLGPAAMVELTGVIAFANLSTRSNTALGIESQGFSGACEIPLAARPERLPA
ncbi:MAG TPA: hypothetical protein VGL51_06255 [Solirubrobacteraceae bacterium]